MRILHLVSAPTMTGPADPALGLARAQLALGHEVRIAFDQVRTGNMRAKVEESEVAIEGDLSLSTTHAFSTSFKDARALKRLAKEVEVIHAHSSHDHALAAAAKGSAQLIRTIHHPRSAARRGLQSWMYARTDGLLFVAEGHRETLLTSYPKVERARTEVVPGAVDVDRFHPGVDGSAIRAEQSIPEDAFLFGIVSRIKPGRGHALLVRAFAQLEAGLLAFVGKGEGVPELKAQVAALGLEARVRFFGFRDTDLPQAFRALDVSVLLAEGNDASCRAVLESMACEVPVIGADRPAIRDALDGLSALVPVDDEEALAAAMRAAMAVRPDGAPFRARVLARHTDRIRAERTLAFYEHCRGLRPS